MKFNYGYEKKKFLIDWAKKKKFMADAGMSAEDIAKMYDFDWNWFKSIRNECNWLVDIDIETIPVFDTEELNLGIEDTVEDLRLVEIFKKLNKEEIELLTKIVIQEYSEMELAVIKKVSNNAISKKLKKFFKKITL